MTTASITATERPTTEDGLTKAEALHLYRQMLVGRRAEERIRDVYPRDQIKTAAHLGIGAEGIVVGVCHCLPKDSMTLGTYRNHVLYLTMTGDVEGFFAELYGKAAGPAKGKAGSMHICNPARGVLATSAVVGTPIPVAVGAALAKQYRNEPGLVAVFFGDGAIEEGVFWESLNFACLRRLPILFICEDNGLAIHTPAAARQGFRTIPDAVQGFNCHAASGDGSHVKDVVGLTRRVITAMAEDPRPGFLHLTYFRFMEHVGPGEDFNVGYRRKPTGEELERLDPVGRMEKDLLGQRWARPEDLTAIRTAVNDEINRSMAAAEQAPLPAADELYRDVLA